MWFGEHPTEFTLWIRQAHGEGRLELLAERNRESVKVPKSEEKEIAKHYREQHKILLARRAEGEIGYIDFEGYE